MCTGDQRGSFQNIKPVQLEETKKVEWQNTSYEEKRLPRVEGRIHDRWVRFFGSLPRAKSDMLNPDASKRLRQQPVASALGTEPTKKGVTTVMKAMANIKVVVPDGLLKFGTQQNRTVLVELHRLITLIWCEGKALKQ